jgi:hypothetical protein
MLYFSLIQLLTNSHMVNENLESEIDYFQTVSITTLVCKQEAIIPIIVIAPMKKIVYPTKMHCS